MIEGHAYIFHLMPILQAPASAHIAPQETVALTTIVTSWGHKHLNPGDDFTPRALTMHDRQRTLLGTSIMYSPIVHCTWAMCIYILLNNQSQIKSFETLCASTVMVTSKVLHQHVQMYGLFRTICIYTCTLTMTYISYIPMGQTLSLVLH